MPSLSSSARLPAAAALVLSIAAAMPAVATPWSQSFNEALSPGAFYWVPNTIGWYWTPTQTASLSVIETRLYAGAFNINNNVNLVVTLYTDRPAASGTALASATFNPTVTLLSDPSWSGKAFAAPVTVTAGTTYFVGFSGWASVVTSSGGAGVNWVNDPAYPGGVPPSGQFLSQAYDGEQFETAIGTATTVTALPVIKFVGNVAPVPEPSEWALMAAGLGVIGLVIRRRGSRG